MKRKMILFYGSQRADILGSTTAKRLTSAAGSQAAPKPRIQPAQAGIAYSSYLLIPTVLMVTNLMMSASSEVSHSRLQSSCRRTALAH